MHKYFKMFSYVGSKRRQLDQIFLLTPKDLNVYVLPFLGSGVILLNTLKLYDEYHLALKQQNILNIFKQCNDNLMLLFLYYYNSMGSMFGNFDYNGFYLFREYYNHSIYNTKTVTEAMALIILISCSINNICRFGPNGYNQSYGQRKITKSKMNLILLSIKKMKSIYNRCCFYNDFEPCIKDKTNSLIILDPPYIERNSTGYKLWNLKLLYRMLKSLSYDNKIIYFDILNDISDLFFNNKIYVLKAIRNISPNRKELSIHKEVIYTNI